MRRLDFTGESAGDRFEIIYDGIIGSGRGYEAPSETRIIGNVLTALEKIGKPMSRGGIATYSLADGGGPVLLEDVEWELAKDALTKVKWNAAGARRATDTIEWFHNAPRHLTGLVEEGAKTS